MSKIEYHTCDIEGCKKNADKISATIPIKFMTEQTEGRGVKPYLSLETIDICDFHYRIIIDENRMPVGYGAQGHNQYNL